MSIPEYVDLVDLKSTINKLKELDPSSWTKDEASVMHMYEQYVAANQELADKIRTSPRQTGKTTMVGHVIENLYPFEQGVVTGYRVKNIGRNRKERRMLGMRS